MANEQNLTHPGITTSEQARILGSKGGSVCSPKKKMAAQMREIKRRGLTNDRAKRVVSIMEDSDMSILDIRLYLEELIPLAEKNWDKLQIIDRMIALHKSHHGEKIKTENTNININIDALKFQEKAEKYSK